jgi:hypothetical protein
MGRDPLTGLRQRRRPQEEDARRIGRDTEYAEKDEEHRQDCVGRDVLKGESEL